MEELWWSIAEWLTSASGVWVIVGSIIFWAGFSYWRFKGRMAPILSAVGGAYTDIQALEGRAGFVEGFEQYDERMRNDPILGHAWKEYGETLIKELDLEPLAIRNSRSASDYFSRANVIGDKLNLRFYSALPNLLTGSGILGTFLGLVAGISLASSGLAADDVEQSKAALGALLHGASLAFMTSIAGLVTSILFSWREKHWVHRLDSCLRKWHEAIEERLLRVTAESLATGQMAQARQQTDVLTQFTNDLAFQIANAFQEQMSASFGPTLERLIESVEGMRADYGRRNDDALQDMLEEFSRKLSGSAGEHLENLGSTLSTVNDQLLTQVKGMGEQQRAMEEASSRAQQEYAELVENATTRMNESLGAALDDVVQQIGGLVGEVAGDLRGAAREAADKLGALNQQFVETLAVAEKSLQEAAELTCAFDELLTSTHSATTSMSQTAEHVSLLLDPLGQLTADIQDSVQQVAGGAGSVSEASQQIVTAISSLTAMQDDIQSVWRRYAERFDSVDESLAGVFTELTTGLSAYTDQVRHFVAELDKHTGSIVSDLASANAELTSSVEELAEVVGRTN